MLDKAPEVKSSLHPLDPLTREEIEKGAKLVKSQLKEESYFCSVALVEPSKDFINNYKSGDVYSRKLRFSGFDNPGTDQPDGGFDAVVDITNQDVSVSRITNGHAPIGFIDVVRAIAITKADKGWQDAMKKRGITNFDMVQIDPWPTGGFQHPSIPKNHRANRAISFIREHKQDNGYAHPVQGLIAHVDLTLGKVAHLEDHGEVPIPEEHGRYDDASQDSLRTPPSELTINQPNGVGFKLNGHEISWHNWRFRVGMHPTSGLVIHQLRIVEDDKERLILHRGALSDMVVPYGDPDPMHAWKHVLDAGEASLGNCVNTLTLGCDCLGEIHYLGHEVIKPDGTVRSVERAICIHEEDFGVLWKHHDSQSQTTEVRRSRRLVVSTFHTVGNYEYGFYWYFYMDGRVQVEVKLTGIVGVSAVQDGQERPEYAPLVAKDVTSPIHQHLFCYRLDFNLEGEENRVYEVNVESDPLGPNNPHGTTFSAHETLLSTEETARRDVNASASRVWKIVNTEIKNKLGKPVAYKLVPDASPKLFAHESSPVVKRAGFAKHNLWVTPFNNDEMSAAGDFPHLSPGDGLPNWSNENRDIVDKDIVVWHSFGSTHIPRPEDWPVMPVEYCGFTLQPVGFFDKNPSINLPGHSKTH